MSLPPSSTSVSLPNRSANASGSNRVPICPYFDVVTDADGQEVLEVYVKGIQLLRFVLTNKGTAFTDEERQDLGLDGLIPPAVCSLEEQIARAFQGFRQQPSMIMKYQYLRGLQERQEILFYALIQSHLEEMLPVVYTPTVGDAVQNFSSLYQHPRGLSFSRPTIEQAQTIIDTYPLNDVRMIVATDSSAILGIGDQGYGGLAISIGKLALYTVGGGVSPFHSLAVSLDVGTDREELLDDPLYLGARHKRIQGDEYIEFVDQFVAGIKKRWPRAIIQWEDLAKESAFAILERYRDEVPSFNDDIQGTGAVTLAGVIAACRMKDEPITDQTFLVYGAGAGGVGVARALRDGLMRAGLSHDDALARVLVLDSRGLLFEGRGITGYKTEFAQKADRIDGWSFEGNAPDLLETVREGGVTTILGLSGQPGSFTKDVVDAVLSHTDRPIIFPLSNPTKLSEILPQDAIRWTGGKAIVAAGSPFPACEFEGTIYPIGQGNNAFIFPGLGHGAILAEATKVTDGMVLASAYALAEYTETHYADDSRAYPPVDELDKVSRFVAAKVIRQAQDDGVATATNIPDGDLTEWVDVKCWKPVYLPTRYVASPENDQ